MNPQRDPRIDAFIAKSGDFARPILTHLRALVHEACPAATETIKWGMPFFEHAGGILCYMAAFKGHCAFGFWHRGMRKLTGEHRASSDEAMGGLGRITSRADLPSDAVLKRLVRAAAKLNESGAPARPPRPKGSGKKLPVPADLAAALKKNAAAAKTFAAFPPSKRKDYIEWLTEAKRDATRQTRLATTIEWLAEGKARNWKYENC